MKMKIKFPKVNVEQIYHDYFSFEWPLIQNSMADLGEEVAEHMRNYISVNTKRKPATGNLAKYMKYELLDTTGKIHWGIGNIEEMMRPGACEYYYVVNYGKMITGQEYVPFHGNSKYGSFDGDRPKKGSGKNQRFEFDGKYKMTPQNAIRPMGYIEFGYDYLRKAVKEILRRYNK